MTRSLTGDGGHARHDRRNLELHRVVAARLLSDPAPILMAARAYIVRWEAAASERQPCWVEWRDLLDRPVEENRRTDHGR